MSLQNMWKLESLQLVDLVNTLNILSISIFHNMGKGKTEFLQSMSYRNSCFEVSGHYLQQCDGSMTPHV